MNRYLAMRSVFIALSKYKHTLVPTNAVEREQNWIFLIHTGSRQPNGQYSNAIGKRLQFVLSFRYESERKVVHKHTSHSPRILAIFVVHQWFNCGKHSTSRHRHRLIVATMEKSKWPIWTNICIQIYGTLSASNLSSGDFGLPPLRLYRLSFVRTSWWRHAHALIA